MCGCTMAEIKLLRVPGTVPWLAGFASRSNLDLRALFESCWRNWTTELGPFCCCKLCNFNRIVDLNRPMELLVNCFEEDLSEPMRMCLKILRRCNDGINRIKYQPLIMAGPGSGTLKLEYIRTKLSKTRTKNYPNAIKYFQNRLKIQNFFATMSWKFLSIVNSELQRGLAPQLPIPNWILSYKKEASSNEEQRDGTH